MSKDKEIDPFRDTPLRYMGYANEVGESFRPLVSRNIVTASYVVAFGYVFADTFFKAYKEKQNSEGSSNKWEKVMICAGDSFIWQTLASVFIPGFTINRICAGTLVVLYKLSQGRKLKFHGGFATAIGLLSIPLIIHPIDDGVTYFMDKTYRKAFADRP